MSANTSLTKSLTPLQDVSKKLGNFITVMGVVVNHMPPKVTSKGEYMTTIILCDTSQNIHGVKARFFAQNERILPRITSNGDIIIVPGIKVTQFNGETILLQDRYMLRYILSRLDKITGIPSSVCYPNSMSMSADDLKQMAQLRSWWKNQGGNTAHSPAQNVTAASWDKRRKFSLIRDMKHGQFYDMVGRVVKMFDSGRWFTVYVTDFSENIRLFPYDPSGNDDTSERKWNGPWGQYTLQVLLWDINATEAKSNMEEGQYIFLKNMHVRENRDSASLKPCYEGVLHGDRKYPDRAGFTIINNPDDSRVRELEQREKEYERRLTQESTKEMQKISEATAARRQKKRKCESEEELGDKGAEEGVESEPEGGNDRVKCQRESQPIASIDFIKRGSFLKQGEYYRNRKYRIFCKVIDFLPRNLEDFAKAVIDEEEKNSEQKWCWRFSLLVEGRCGATLPVIVEGKDGEYLLQFKATNLREDAGALATLREKLSILWGGLEKKKAAELQALEKPTNCQPVAESLPPPGKGKKRRNRGNKSNKKSKVEHTDSRSELGDSVKSELDEDDKEAKEQDTEAEFFKAAVLEFGLPKDNDTFDRKWRLFGTTIHA
ncbi:hypothetical protein K440DRAFT_204851 [Wilcoxina mikolae CBS 423.85]|nr:hypothetical protein K440DRAFT_204851 [Wilcoxina mikolae CBS 423.85]